MLPLRLTLPETKTLNTLHRVSLSRKQILNLKLSFAGKFKIKFKYKKKKNCVDSERLKSLDINLLRVQNKKVSQVLNNNYF